MRRVLYFCLFLSLSASSLFAQTASINGDWEGELSIPGTKLKMILSISGEADSPVITVDVPIQSINDMEATEVTFSGNKLRFKLPGVPGNASWGGAFKAADVEGALDSLIGNWNQGGRTLAVNFARPSGPLAGEALAANLVKIETYAADLLKRMNVPGAGIAIIHGEKVVKSFGVGYADLNAQRPATGNTVFAIGSSSKAFTAFGNALLVDEGKLEWDKPVREYMPDFRMYDDFATEEMTAVDLLTHQSGLPRHDLLWYLNGELTREDLYQRLRYLEPTKSFRSAWQYQNLMYMTAGILTERISGMSWEEYTRKNIFEPLGMTSANFDINSLPSLPDYALGYGEKEGELEVLPYHPLPAIGPAGSINASAADMGKWVALHLNGGKVGDRQLITPSILKELHRSRAYASPNDPSSNVYHVGYALGWFTYDWNGYYIVEHGGNIDGFSAQVYMAPAENVGFVVLTNKNATSYGSLLSRYALEVLTGKEATDYYGGDKDGEDEEDEEKEEEDEEKESPFAKAKPQRDNAAYVGTYLDEGYGEVVIAEVDGKLRLNYGDLDASLEPYHFEVFLAELETIGMEMKVNFIAGANGKIRSLEIAAEAALDHPIIFAKQADASMKSPEYLDKLVGTYNLDGQQLTIKRVRDYITLDVPGQPTYDLEAANDNEFKLTIASGYSVEFYFKGDKVVALELHQPNGDFRAEKE
ncbi:MAG: serine hydrolase [Bacteroidota bacterium]